MVKLHGDACVDTHHSHICDVASVFCSIFFSHTQSMYIFFNIQHIKLDLSKSEQNQTYTCVRDSLYTSLINSHCWNKRVSFCTMHITAFLHVITKMCLLCVISKWPYPQQEVDLHCCSMSLLLAFCFHLFQTFTIWKNECVIQHCVSECSPGYQHFYIPETQIDDASGYITFVFISVVHDSRMQKWNSWESCQSWSTNFFHSFKATITSFF